MQENKFEKQVQQKMEELSLTPSAPVWQNIEQQIKTKKDRRRVVLWLLPLLFLAGGIVWWQWSAHEQSVADHKIAKQQPKTNGATAVPAGKPAIATSGDPQQQTTKTENASIDKAPETITATQKTNDFEKVAVTTNIPSKTEKITASKKKPATVKEAYAKVSPQTVIPVQEIHKEKEGKEVISFPPSVTINENEKVSENVFYQQADIAVTTPDRITLKETVANDSQPLKDILASVETAVATNENKKVGKWQWGISGRAGISGIADGVFASGANIFQDRYAASPNSNTGGVSWSPAPPSEIKSNLSFSVGATIKRKAGKRSFISAGLQYSYYSNQLNVGSRGTNDTLISFSAGRLRAERYYQNNGSFNQYNNRYQHIELPLGFEYQLFKNVPLHIHHGFSVSRLVASNALYYNADANLYYQSKDVLQRTGLHLFTAVDYKLVNSKTFSFYAGPQLQYSISQLYKSGTPGNQHLRFAGLKTRLFF